MREGWEGSEANDDGGWGIGDKGEVKHKVTIKRGRGTGKL